MKNQESPTYYKVTYRDPKDGKTVDLKAKTIKDSNLGLSFIFVSDFILSHEMSFFITAKDNIILDKVIHENIHHEIIPTLNDRISFINDFKSLISIYRLLKIYKRKRYKNSFY